MGETVPTDNIERVERELAKEDSLLANMLEQAPGMLGMALMFVVTIALGIWLRPFFDEAGLHAFGEAGTTQGRWIIMELGAIFLFTFAILWLAKNHMEVIIKYGLLAVLFLALCYTTVPGAHILLVEDTVVEPFVLTNESEIEEDLVFISSTGEMITQELTFGDRANMTVGLTMRDAFSDEIAWNVTLHTWPAEPFVFVTEGDYGYTVSNAAWIWTLDKETGEVLTQYQCFESAEGNNSGDTNVIPIDELPGLCGAVVEVVENADGQPGEKKGAVYIISANEFIRRSTFHDSNVTTHSAKWSLPALYYTDSPIHAEQLDEKHLFIASSTGAIIIELEETTDAPIGGNFMEVYPVNDVWWRNVTDGDNITAFAKGGSMFDDEIDNLMLFGFDSGKIEAYNWDDQEITVEDSMGVGDYFSGPITALSLQDENENGWDEIWVANSDGVHGLYYSNLVERVTIEDSTIADFDYLVIQNSTIATISDNTTNVKIQTGPFSESMYNISGIQWSSAAILIGIGLAALLMLGLIIRPEWYIVNTVGVLVGAGVIVMLGVTFVPTLVMIFMILAAIYDAWAVYRSKHMLDLADTMIGLNLPILLVAPQEKGYSMLDEQAPIRTPPPSSPPPSSAAPKMKVKRKKAKEAMFMGLGDVIFPGMLVVSCVQWITTSGLAVGISTLIGGLVGYFVLMGFVASGRPQAGLPLLNGGAILGYIIGGLIFVGSAAFSFGITL
ncbi:MAG: Uncharacterised protein [Methanobacteriota archaeon]|nr:MAG: Uncharacterised protein [Euryarchaeota archaeon]|tara:strand:+ start:2194 stop:4371 length:2178 start_codon:yes stop_codon:yes gene_type:complete